MPGGLSTLSASVFILTSEWQDKNAKHLLRFYGKSPQLGPVEIIVDSFRPLFFIPRDTVLPKLPCTCQRKPGEMKAMDGGSVDVLYFQTQKDLVAVREKLTDLHIQTFESDIQPPDRYLMERFIHGSAKVVGKASAAGGITTFYNPQFVTEDVPAEFVTVSIDIETDKEASKLYSIAVHLRQAKKDVTRVFITGQSADFGDVLFLKNEKELLCSFMQWLVEADPDFVIGWNVVGFDLTVLERKCREHGLTFAIGRQGRKVIVRPRKAGGYYAVIPGRVIMDGPVFLRGAFFSFPDFRLDEVACELLGEGKMIDSSREKVAEIERMYREDPQAFARYNRQDAILVSKIFEKTGLIDLYVKRTKISGLLLENVGRSAQAFDYVFLPRLHRKGYVAKNVFDVFLSEHSAGGHVMEPAAGIHENVFVFDFKSLYPSIIRTFKIDPLSRALAQTGALAKVVKTPAGICFARDESILPELICDLMDKRAHARRQGDEHLSQAIKILMNSFYGVMGSAGCRFYHHDLPTAITGTGRWLLLETKTFLESEGYQVIYGDTDSLFVKTGAALTDNTDEFGQCLAQTLNRYWEQRIRREFDLKSCLELEYEKYYSKFLLPAARGREGGAKKRYAGLLLNAAGKSRVDFVGMEAVRTDWTEAAKNFQKELYAKVFQGEDVSNWVRQFVKDLRQGRKDSQLVYHKRLRKPVEAYTKNVPPHVKAARQMSGRIRDVRYVVTPAGPVPVGLKNSGIDYEHYIEKQLKPVADSILVFTGQCFDGLVKTSQLMLL